MTSNRRTGTETSKTRVLLLDATVQLMLQEGYGAVSSRRVASTAGVTPALVHYYFPTLNDLFLAVLRRHAAQEIERQARALKDPHPMRALWTFSYEPPGSALTQEFMALAHHRQAIRGELVSYAERFRAMQLEAFEDRAARQQGTPRTIPPEALVFLIACVSRALVQERSLGITACHAETLKVVEGYLQALEAESVSRSPEGNGSTTPAAYGARRTGASRRRAGLPRR